MPTVIFMMLAGLALASVGAVSSIRAQEGTTRDQDSKEAFAAAEAGVSLALLHYNRVPVTSAAPCIASDGGTLYTTAASAGWCPAVPGSTAGGTFSYRVAPTAGQVEIVSTGSAGTATRKVDVTANSASGQPIFQTAGVQTGDGITMDSNAEIRSNTATNGNMLMNGNAKLCGSGSVGIGRTLTTDGNSTHNSNTNCTGTGVVQNKALTLPLVNQGNAATVNDNGRFFTQDIRTSPSDVTWNSGTRRLTLDANSSLTLGGSTYSFCRLTLLSNAAIYVAPGATVRIFFDTPEACGLSSGTTQFRMDSNTRITGSSGAPANLAILMMGSATRQTIIDFDANTQVASACNQNFVIYAPRTDVIMDSNSVYCGALAGKSLTMNSNARIYTDGAALNFQLPNTAAHYTVSQFIECSSPSASPPDANC